MKGNLITLEGLDGSGKATQTELLCRELTNKGVNLRRISFPNYDDMSSSLVKMYLNGEFGTNPNDVNPYAASSFFAVDRYASYKKYWGKDYEKGNLIIADRYTTSNIVFQLSKMPKEHWKDFINWVEDYEYNKLMLPRPNKTIYLSMPTEVSQKLLDVRYKGNEDKKDIHEGNEDFLKACYESGLYAADKLNWKVINCADGGNPKTINKVHEEIMIEIYDILNKL